jgi:hypothetical protein
MNGSTPLSEAFAALGIEPTLDPLSVKRAYFAAVAQTPPYRDALAFGRIRSAYEALMQPGGLEAAYLLAPLDAARETAGLRERYGSALAEARQRIASQHADEQKVQAFVAAATTTLSAFLERVARR